MYTLMRRKNEGLEDEAISFAQRLVRTYSPSLQERDAARAVESQMQRLAFDQVFCDDYGNVVGLMLGKENGPTVLLNSHLDTIVPPENGDQKSSHASGEIFQGRLYGTGAADCKGGIVAQIYAGALLKRALLPLRGNLIVALTVAEENGCSVGVRGLMQTTLPKLGLKPDFAILGEPTGLGMYYGHDGWMEVDIRVMGNSPFEVGEGAEAIFEDLKERSDLIKPVWCREDLAVSPPRFQDAPDGRLGMIHLARRLGPREATEPILRQMQNEAKLVAQDLGALAVEVQVREEEQQLWNGRLTTVKRITHAWNTDPFHPQLQRAYHALAAAGCDPRTARWELGRLGMGTAGSVLTGEFNVPTIGYGPGFEEQAHAPEEWVKVDNIAEAIYGTAAMVQGLIGVPVFGWTSDEI